MGDFHRQLVEARRNGTAPGMDAGPASDAKPTAPTYIAVPEGMPLLSCSRCGGTVTADRAPQHTDWHIRLGD